MKEKPTATTETHTACFESLQTVVLYPDPPSTLQEEKSSGNKAIQTVATACAVSTDTYPECLVCTCL